MQADRGGGVVAAPGSDVPSWRSWYLVVLLATLYGLSFVDRYILGLVVNPVSHDLGIGDAQMGLLLGAGFAVVYAIAGLPLAHLIDNRERRWIVVGGVALWSLTTIASAFAASFGLLAVCRAGVAIGEAVLTPAAVSLIADMFPGHKRALPVAIYASVSGYMSMGAFIIGGAALQFAHGLQASVHLAPWRIALILVGIPGLVLAALMLVTVREPRRSGSSLARAEAVDFGADLAGFLQHLSGKWRFYASYLFGTGFLAMFSLGMVSWAPTLLVRAYGLEPAKAGLLLGVIGVPAALAGAAFWPWLANRLQSRGMPDGIMRAYLLSAIVVAPILIFAPQAASLPLLLAGLAAAIFCLGTAGTLTPLVVQTYGPPRMRGRLMALTLLFIHLIGYTTGPLIVALAAERWPGDHRALANGLSVLGLLSGPLAILCLTYARATVAKGRTDPYASSADVASVSVVSPQ